MLIILIELKRTRAQGHRTMEQSRLELMEVMSPTPVLEDGHWVQVAQGCVQLGFEYMQGWRLHNLSG